MVDDYICHCPQIPLMHCLQQISQLPFTTICCVQWIKISWKISWTQQNNTHIPIEKLHKKSEQNYCWFAATSAITVGPPLSICGLLKIFLFVQETKIKSASASPYADDDWDLVSKAWGKEWSRIVCRHPWRVTKKLAKSCKFGVRHKPWGARESKAGGSHIEVKPHAESSETLSFSLFHHDCCLCDSQLKPWTPHPPNQLW